MSPGKRGLSGEVWDAVVVGAGPAGSAMAARLARGGHRVLLLDRERFPRPKPCGECLSPAGLAALERLGAADAVRAHDPPRLHGWRLHPLRADAFEGRFPEGRHGIGIRRELLDRLLVETARAAGAEVRAGTHVVDVERHGGQVVGVQVARGTGRELIPARLVVGADGLRSVVVRRLDLIRRGPKLRKLALTAHVGGLEGLDGHGELHVRRWGCIGAARVDDGSANVTVVLAGPEAAQAAGARAERFDAAMRELPRFHGARREGDVLATGPFDWPTHDVVADGALLVGDAAGYYDPFTGQGMFRALRGAELAAETADRALRQGDVSARSLAPYRRARRRAFAPGLRVQRLVEAVVGRPALFDRVAPLLRRAPGLADALVAVTGDLRPARTLLWPGSW